MTSTTRQYCICDGRYDGCDHSSPCPSPSAGTHGPWCGACNRERFARINKGFAEIAARLATPSPGVPS